MFDFVPTETRHAPLAPVRCLFSDHGHELAEAAALLGGAPAEAKVVSCALQIQEAHDITPRILRDLVSLYQLLSLDRVGAPDCVESALFSRIDPASRMVETICLLADMLADILDAFGAADQTHHATFLADQLLAD